MSMEGKSNTYLYSSNPEIDPLVKGSPYPWLQRHVAHVPAAAALLDEIVQQSAPGPAPSAPVPSAAAAPAAFLALAASSEED